MVVLWLAGVVLTALFGWIAIDSFAFDVLTVSSDPAALQQRPILRVLSAFGLAFAVWLSTSLWLLRKNPGAFRRDDASSCPQPMNWRSCLSRRVGVIVLFGLLFRLILLFSMPIQEVDIYRYILDGAYANAGIDPWQFAPVEISAALEERGADAADAEVSDPFERTERQQQQLDSLVQYISQRPGLRQCIGQVHYGELTSPYPPVSQWVFRAAIWFIPAKSSARTCLRAMKAVLIGFDVATGLLLIGLLSSCRLQAELSVVYWWCPLVLKEIANSGHLDSIAVMLTVGFAWLAIRFGFDFFSNAASETTAKDYALKQFFAGLAACLTLALAVAAKIYPVVLAPIWAVLVFRAFRVRGLFLLVVFIATSLACLLPQLRHTRSFQQSTINDILIHSNLSSDRVSRQISKTPPAKRPTAGIEAFSQSWEMNDLLFMVVIENLKPDAESSSPTSRPWFRVTTNDWRDWLVSRYQPVAGVPAEQVPFWLTRRITIGIYALITIVLCVLAVGARRPEDWLSLCFFSIALFWMLSPTQNPWYFVWAVPLIPFVRRPLPWLVISGTLFLYYLRFLFQYHFSQTNVMGTGYVGTTFFDFVVPWIEFGPSCILLAISVLLDVIRKN